MEVRESSAKYLARSAYKQTEVGAIPEDWNAEKLGAHATFRTGPFGSALHQSDYVYGGVPVINPMQIVDGKIIPTPSMSISEAAASSLSDYRIAENEILIGRRGEMGRCAVVLPEQRGWLCGTGSMIIRSKASLDARFAQRVLSSPPVIAEIENASVGTTMINLNQGTLSNLLIPVPPTLVEQQAIAEALSDADALVEALEQLLAKKRQIKQGAMQELLTGQKRLPGFAGEWEKTTLGAIAERIVGGGTPSRNNPLYWSGSIPWMTVKDFANFSPCGTLEYITKEGLESSASNLVPCGTLITSTRMAIGKAVIFEVDVAINQDLKAIHFRKDIDPDFLYFWFQFNESRIAALGSGSTVMGISLPELRKFQLLKPELAEQTAIATVLSDMDTEIAALEARLAKARGVKQGMMQELLTGRIRLI